VTGGSGGIGSACCRALITAGAHVLVSGRSMERVSELAEELRARGAGATPLELDVTDRAQAAEVAERVRREHGTLGWLVNNAGGVATASLLGDEADEAHFAWHMELNFHGARRVLEAFLPDMLAAGHGRVVQVASSAALRGYPYVAAYAASKHALLGYTRSAVLELAPRGVAINTVCPHFVDSPLTNAGAARAAARTGKSVEEIKASYAALNPSGVLLTPEEVAGAVLGQLRGDATGAVLELLGDSRTEVVEHGTRIVAAAGGGR
jgi:NAD(P)-dependent dehydrogenase (short-subunit alcohol dehydrogenase family)